MEEMWTLLFLVLFAECTKDCIRQKDRLKRWVGVYWGAGICNRYIL